MSCIAVGQFSRDEALSIPGDNAAPKIATALIPAVGTVISGIKMSECHEQMQSFNKSEAEKNAKLSALSREMLSLRMKVSCLPMQSFSLTAEGLEQKQSELEQETSQLQQRMTQERQSLLDLQKEATKNKIRSFEVINQYLVANIVNYSLISIALITLVALKIIGAPFGIGFVIGCTMMSLFNICLISVNAEKIRKLKLPPPSSLSVLRNSFEQN